MSTTIEANKNVLDFIYSFKDIAQKHNWVTRYDTEADAFSFSVKNLPQDARLKYFGDEVAFYVTKDGDVKGFFIEYFKNNFIKHNKEVKDVIKGVKKSNHFEEASIVELKNTKKSVAQLDDALKEVMAENINLTPQT